MFDEILSLLKSTSIPSSLSTEMVSSRSILINGFLKKIDVPGFFLKLTKTQLGAIAFAVTAVGGLIIYSFTLKRKLYIVNQENKALEGHNKTLQQENQDKLQELIDSIAEIDTLKEIVTSLAARIKLINQELDSSKKEEAVLIQERDEADLLKQAAESRIRELEEELELEKAGGASSTPGIFPLEYYQASYYSAALMNKLIFNRIQQKYKSVLAMENGFILANQIVLPALVVSDKDWERFGKTFQDLIHQYRKPRLLCPLLHNQHWYNLELQFEAADNGPKVKAYLHDPRGGGQLPAALAERLLAVLQTGYGKAVQLLTPESPYTTTRQSAADKISCGPIVMEELGKLMGSKNLDRKCPHGFGASELVAKQQKQVPEVLTGIAATRYRFLNNPPKQLSQESSVDPLYNAMKNNSIYCR